VPNRAIAISVSFHFMGHLLSWELGNAT
jgi:hypothetical protein